MRLSDSSCKRCTQKQPIDYATEEKRLVAQVRALERHVPYALDQRQPLNIQMPQESVSPK
jgi:hypothetical protein